MGNKKAAVVYAASHTEPDDQIKMIALTDIAVDADQPRKHFDSEALIELAESIKHEGLAQPILVEPNPDSPIPKYKLIAGERRYHASGLAEKKEILARIRIGLSRDQVVVLQAVENIQREPLCLDEICAMCARLVGQLGFDGAAKKLGKSKPWVSRRAAVMEMTGEVMTAIAEGIIGDIDAAHELNKLFELESDYAVQLLSDTRDDGGTLSRGALKVELSDREAAARERATREKQAQLDLDAGKHRAQGSYQSVLDDIARTKSEGERQPAITEKLGAQADGRGADSSGPITPPHSTARVPAPVSPQKQAEQEEKERRKQTEDRLERRFTVACGSDPDADEIPEEHIATVMAQEGSNCFYFHAELTEQQIDQLCDAIEGKAQNSAISRPVTGAIDRFILSQIERVPGDLATQKANSVGAADLYRAYCDWAKADVSLPLPKEVFVYILADHGIESFRTMHGTFYAGVKLKAVA